MSEYTYVVSSTFDIVNLSSNINNSIIITKKVISIGFNNNNLPSPNLSIIFSQSLSNTEETELLNLINTNETIITQSSANTSKSTTYTVRLATDVSGTLATDFIVGSLVDGIALKKNDVILIKNQLNAIENGLYIIDISGAPTRTVLDISANAAGFLAVVSEGNINNNTLWICTNTIGSDLVGTSNLSFAFMAGVGGQKGAKGDIGQFGGASFCFLYKDNSNNIVDLDPAPQGFTFDTSLLANITYVDVATTDCCGVNISQFLQTINSSTSSIKGTLKITNAINSGEYAYFAIDASSVLINTFYQIPLIYNASSVASFTHGDSYYMSIAVTGDRGDKGDKGIKGDIGVTGSQGIQGVKGDPGSLSIEKYLVTHELSTGTQGGSATAGDWYDLSLNLILSDPSGVTNAILSNNQIVLNPGRYKIDAVKSFYRTNVSQIRIYNFTNSLTINNGITVKATNSNSHSHCIEASVSCNINILSANIIKIQYYVENNRSIDGLGVANGFGSSEVYTKVFIEKIS